jgi:para-nitrobenzyl esterase
MINRRLLLHELLALGVWSRTRAASGGVPILQTRAGRIRGRVIGGALAYLGIPYGASTAGRDRFRPPRDPEPWSGVLETIDFGPRAPQGDLPGAAPAEPQSENCLVLNVYTSRIDHGRRPVMVFLHGGGYASGSGGAHYPGSSLVVHHEVVLVTLNHRLNVLGFLDLASVDERFSDSANAGLLDLIAALRWVREHIASFGGDPDNVTIFGQSGGGAKVSALLAAPSARGLFHRAIPMSGAVLRALTREQSSELAQELARELGIAMNDVDSWQSLPAGRLIGAMMAMGATGNPWSTRLNAGPTIDGRTLTHQLCDPSAPSESIRVPILVGSTHDETNRFYAREAADPSFDATVARARLVSTMKTNVSTADAVYAAFSALRPGQSPAQLFELITTHYMFTRNSVLAAERFSSRRAAQVFLYRFDWVPPEASVATLGAVHGTDVPLVLDQATLDEQPAGDAARALMAHTMSELWTSFARDGRPAARSTPHWPHYELVHRPVMLLNNVSRRIDDPDSDVRALYPLLPDFHP